MDGSPEFTQENHPIAILKTPEAIAQLFDLLASDANEMPSKLK
jgi:hypothetical protein